MRPFLSTGLLLTLALLLVSCAAAPKPPMEIPTSVQVQGGPLAVHVTTPTKRPLTGPELPPDMKAGYRWDFQVSLSDPLNVGAKINRIRMKVQSATGQSRDDEAPFGLTLEPGGSTEASFHGFLAVTDPSHTVGLTGTETIYLEGRTTEGESEPFTITIVVPLQ